MTRLSSGCLDCALHKPANVAHRDGEIVLSLQVDPELRSRTLARPRHHLSRRRAGAGFPARLPKIPCTAGKIPFSVVREFLREGPVCFAFSWSKRRGQALFLKIP